LGNGIRADFYDNQRAIVRSLHRKKTLEPGLGITCAADIVGA
jgi:hypothetical protein